MPTVDDIVQRANENLGRVENLIKLYEDDLPGEGSGRRPQNSTDVLRAAVVFLHATLEDFLRSLEKQLLPPNITEAELRKIPLANSGLNASKFWLDDLLPFKGQSIDDVLDKSISDHLDKRSYNDKEAIFQAVSRIGINPDDIGVNFGDLDEMAKRRHHIVHQADRNESTGSGHHQTQSLSLAKVKRWRSKVNKFVVQVIDEIGTAD